MKGYLRGTKSDKEIEKDLEKNVHFGVKDFEWVNPALKIIHDKLSQYYIDGKLRVWNPADSDYDPWEGYDYPHKYNVIGDLDRPNGVYFFSDIEKFIESKYGLKDDQLYDFIIYNQYIEGRYWERVWSFPIDEKDPNKLDRNGFRMKATENINHILNVIEIEFKNEIKGTDYEGFPVYIDYYKKVDPNY